MSNARKHFSEREMLEASRDTSRTFGCFGVSLVAHAALLAALAIIPLTIQSIGGDDAGGSATGAVSLVDSGAAGDAVAGNSKMEATSNDIANAQLMEGDINSVASGATANSAIVTDVAPTSEPTVASSTLTDSSSEIVTVKPRTKIVAPTAPAAAAPKKAPVSKLVAEKPKAAPVAQVEIADVANAKEETPAEVASEPVEETPAPVLLANPPSDDEKPEPVKQEPAPIAESKKIEEPAARFVPEPAPESAKESAAKGDSQSDSNSASAKAATGSQAAESDTSSAAGDSSNGTDSNSGSGGHGGSARSGNSNSGGEEGSGESSGSVAGPVRDASELKALPGNPNPSYPARDRLAKREGTAVVLGRVSPDGRISEISIERSSGSPQMDAASVQAFRNWKFQAGQQGWVRKPFQFRLVGEAKEVPAPLGKTLQR